MKINNKDVAILDYGVGNLNSIKNFIKKIGYNPIITSNKIILKKCKAIILPGVGSFNIAIKNIKKKKLIYFLKNFSNSNQKLIGICLGMQIMCKSSSENGINNGLNIFKGKVTKLKKINVGWRSIVLKTFFLKKLRHLKNFFYYNHSYYYSSKDLSIIAKTNSLDIPAILKIKNNFGIQFHPEKSQDSGILLFKDILKC
jgi:glutamine amidotransferase